MIRGKLKMKLKQKLTYHNAYRPMKLITFKDFCSFSAKTHEVMVENVKIKLRKSWSISESDPPENYKYESFTVWSFPNRGDWATHTGNYRGNWSPYIPRNLISRYTKPGEWVLDQMVGSGTTLTECKLLGRNGIGVDINGEAIMVAWDRQNFNYTPEDSTYPRNLEIKLYVGDARNLDEIKDETIDLIATHPPYGSIISYSKNRIEDDLSTLSLEEYLEAMKRVAEESLRVLKPGKHCAILIGDTRKHKHYVPISNRVMQAFLDAGFILKRILSRYSIKLRQPGRNGAVETAISIRSLMNTSTYSENLGNMKN